VDLPCCSTVMHGDLPPRSIDKPPENIVKVSLHDQNEQKERNRSEKTFPSFNYIISQSLPISLCFQLYFMNWFT
jgi:hypothetical protein